MNIKKDIQNHVELLQKGNKGLYGLSILVGIVTGIIVSIYRYGLAFAEILRNKYINKDLLTNPVKLISIWMLFIAIGLFVDYLSKKFPTTAGSGIPQVKALILRKLDYLFWPKELLVKFFGGLLGIGAGLSLGREGPSVQLGSYIGYGFTKIFKRNYIDEKYLVTAGSSAGLAGAFGAPLSGVIFSMEELHRFFSSKLIICTFLASICSNFVSRRIFDMKTSFDLYTKYPADLNPYLQFLFFIAFGIILAFFGKLFTVSLTKTQDVFRDIKLPRAFKISSVMTLAFIICFIMPDLAGGGHHLVEQMPHLNQTILFLLFIFIVKLLFTTISYATGFQGGIFLPMLVLGAILGKIYALILISGFGLGQEMIIHYMILGMAGFFVAVVRAPITGIILILEMTGSFDHLLAIATISIVAYYVTELLKLEPIYEILYERMPKKKIVDDLEDECHEHKEKAIICIPVSAESEFENKLIKDVKWPENCLVIGIKRSEVEYIPKGNTKILAGDIIVLLLSDKQADISNEELFKMGVSH
ncbi:MAG: ClC family H(+)/Cl(-) exchange transporter [Fusobacteriaceae bacterium]